jgi:DoxX-like family
MEEYVVQTDTQTAADSKNRIRAGHIISALPVLFLLFDGVTKLLKPPFVVEPTVRLGYPESVIIGLGFTLTACTVLYVIPRTSILGAILLTGYLGGAISAQVRVGASLFSVVFPVILGVLLWLGLYMRDQRLQALIPLRS